MPELLKAEMLKLGTEPDSEPVGDPIPVQFNPTTLRLQMSNSFDGGNTRSRQSRQYQGNSSTTLSVELVFDTSDEGTTESPRSVREKTNPIAEFLLPTEGSQEPPPRVRFHWGDFVLDGVMSEMSEEIDLFSPGGVPLRAKVSLTIKEQDARFTALEIGSGAGDTSAATDPGEGSGQPGTSGNGEGDRTAAALADESLADFAARNGLDPSAWRAIAGAIDDVLSLPLGAEIDFSASLSASLGVGVSLGFEAGLSASLEASLGLEAGISAAAGAEASLGSGMALTAAGGTSAALNTVASARATEAADSARASFGVAAAGPAPVAAAVRTPLQKGGALPSPREQAATPGAARAAAVDARAVTYGAGVPLRSRVTAAGEERAEQVTGNVVVAPRAAEGAPGARGTATPAWERLPKAGEDQAAADAEQARRAPVRPCGCRRSCPHRRTWA